MNFYFLYSLLLFLTFKNSLIEGGTSIKKTLSNSSDLLKKAIQNNIYKTDNSIAQNDMENLKQYHINNYEELTEFEIFLNNLEKKIKKNEKNCYKNSNKLLKEYNLFFEDLFKLGEEVNNILKDLKKNISKDLANKELKITEERKHEILKKIYNYFNKRNENVIKINNLKPKYEEMKEELIKINNSKNCWLNKEYKNKLFVIKNYSYKFTTAIEKVKKLAGEIDQKEINNLNFLETPNHHNFNLERSKSNGNIQTIYDHQKRKENTTTIKKIASNSSISSLFQNDTKKEAKKLLSEFESTVKKWDEIVEKRKLISKLVNKIDELKNEIEKEINLFEKRDELIYFDNKILSIANQKIIDYEQFSFENLEKELIENKSEEMVALKELYLQIKNKSLIIYLTHKYKENKSINLNDNILKEFEENANEELLTEYNKEDIKTLSAFKSKKILQNYGIVQINGGFFNQLTQEYF